MVVRNNDIVEDDYRKHDINDDEKIATESTDSEQIVSEVSELSRLKTLVPTVCIKDNVTQLDIILEAIRYIDSLRDRLVSRGIKEEDLYLDHAEEDLVDNFDDNEIEEANTDDEENHKKK